MNLRASSENIFLFKNFVDPLDPFLAYQGFVVLDGGLATELERFGANLDDPLWSTKILVESPELVSQVHENYVLSGADIITSCSYQSSFEAFEKKGIQHNDAKALFEKSILLAKQAVDKIWDKMKDDIDSGGTSFSTSRHRLKPLVAGSIGPYGSCEGSEFLGNYGKSIEFLMNFHRSKLSAILGANPDLVIFETIPCANEEITAIANIMQENSFKNVPAIVSFSCKDSTHTCCGELIEDGFKIASSIPNIVSVGFNCTSPYHINGLIDAVSKFSTKPIIVYPNSGEIFDVKSKVWKGSKCEISSYLEGWFKKGAKIFGGCCRTNPQDINQIRTILQSINLKNLKPASATENVYRKLSASIEMRPTI
jgi:homocysteine S-methyltransferase